MKLLLAFLAAYLVAGVASLHVKFEPCKGDTVESAEVAFFDISPCSQDPCLMTRGSTYEVTVPFTTGAAPASIETATTHLYGIIGGIKVPFPGFNNTVACKNSGLTCPLKASTSYTFAIPIYLNPKLTVDITCVVELRIVDDATGKDIICDEVEVKVVG